jgi:predicted metal-dependent peptidase
MNAEQIYDILEKDPSQLPPPPKGGGGSGQGQPGQPGQGTPQQGQGAGSQTGPGRQAPNGGLPEGDIRKPGSLDGCGTKVYEGSKSINEAESTKDLEEAWRKIRDDAATRNQGTGSDSFDRWVRKLNKPKINWRVELRKFVKNVFDELDFGYSNKRFIWQDKHLPTAKEIDTSSYQNVVIAIDTSGSIGDETLGKFATEMMKLFKDYAIQEVTVIWCDSEIPRGGIQQFAVADKNFDLKKLKPVGGGGTSFKPPFMWVEQYLIKKHKTPAFMIYFTDACGDAPLPTQFRIREYHDRVMWVITETESAPHIKFGKKIFIDKLAN